MSEQKHTPGEWVVCHPHGEYDDRGASVVCEVERLFGAPITIRSTQSEMGTLDHHEAESLANARLIAAAPEMLTLLERAGEADSPNDDTRTAWWEARNAAIAKATGGSHDKE